MFIILNLRTEKWQYSTLVSPVLSETKSCLIRLPRELLLYFEKGQIYDKEDTSCSHNFFCDIKYTSISILQLSILTPNSFGENARMIPAQEHS